MSTIMNGLALHGGIIPYGGTFLTFSDYAKSAVRHAALMKQRVIFVYSHDSIALGEDGPTHQPVEHLATFRFMPNIMVWRPATFLETAVAWIESINQKDTPSTIVLSRQVLPHIHHNEKDINKIKRGGYIIFEPSSFPEIILIATGSEVNLAVKAAVILQEENILARVISMPCVDKFLAQSVAYQAKILPDTIRKRIAIEASASAYWRQFVGLDGFVIGLDQFGQSAPGDIIYNELGFNVASIITEVQKLLKKE